MKIIIKKDNTLKPTIFLDRDGTINKDTKGKYILKIKDIKIYKTFIEGFKKFNFSKYRLIIITNQSAIGRKYISLKDSIKINLEIVKQLKKEKINISAIYFCPHKPEDKCNCRKPKIGLYNEIKKDFKINKKESYMIGDKNSDMEFAKKLNLKSIFVLTGQGKDQIKKNKIKANFFLNNLKYIKKILN